MSEIFFCIDIFLGSCHHVMLLISQVVNFVKGFIDIDISTYIYSKKRQRMSERSHTTLQHCVKFSKIQKCDKGKHRG